MVRVANSRRLAAVTVPTVAALAVLTACGSESREQISTAQSCMKCHNGSPHDDYAGPGLENPHPFAPADNLQCTTCHGGNPNGIDRGTSHVPPPPAIGDREQQIEDRYAYFNKLTLTGLDKQPDYVVGGTTYTALDYLQFVNPGDLRVVNDSRACGQCHAGHGETVAKSLLATEAGILAGAMYAIGVESQLPASQGLYQNTAADLGFRAVQDPNYVANSADIGAVPELLEFPVYSTRGIEGDELLFRNPLFDSNDLPNDLEADNSVRTGSRLASLFHEQVAFMCGDCHLGSAGANNRYGDFRSSGCTSCHMPYSLDGRSRSADPNVPKDEPLDPDDIEPPERPHVRTHKIASVRKTLPSGEVISGIDDYACAGCHQGSNRTVMQYWGIRLDQNQDLRRGVQYPANPVSFQNTRNDTRLFDPVVGNRTFNGRNANQYILFEDYDGDDRDDTPADVHYEAGMGCIDCHGSYDLHGGDVTDPGGNRIRSRMEQHVGIECESCHGGIDAYATTQVGIAHDGTTANLAVDSKGNILPHVVLETDGHYYLYSRLTGRRHYLRQTRDTIVNNARRNTITGELLYSSKASYAMGRADGDHLTGIGPQQTNGPLNGFTHTSRMDCATCHSSWTNSCIGCHLEGEYNGGNNFSNITGDRIVFREREADFVYQTPVPFQLGIGPDNQISQIIPNTETFFTYEDLNNVDSRVFAFSDRNGNGNDPGVLNPSLGHNAMLAHSIRGKVSPQNEGPRYCVACHLTDNSLQQYGSIYDTFRSQMAAAQYGQLDFDMLQQHIGLNPGNQMDSPIWVHMVAGLGSGLFLFDENGCPINPLDQDDERKGCDNGAPADNFVPGQVTLDLDRIVERSGRTTGSNNHPMLTPNPSPNMRDGAQNPNLAGPLGSTLIERLTDPTTGIILNSWLDADGATRGGAGTFTGN